MKSSAPAGCSGAWGSARMPTITTGSTGRRSILPKKQKSGRRLMRFTTGTTVLTAIAAWRPIWSARDTTTALQLSINIWILKWACIPSSALKNRGRNRGSRLKYSKTGWGRTSMRTSQTKSGVQISHIYFWKLGRSVITAHHRPLWPQCDRQHNRPAYHQWPGNPHAEEGVGFTAPFKRRADPAQWPGKPVYVKGFCRVLWVCPCVPEHQ